MCSPVTLMHLLFHSKASSGRLAWGEPGIIQSGCRCEEEPIPVRFYVLVIVWTEHRMENVRNGPCAFVFMGTLNLMARPNLEVWSNWRLRLILDMECSFIMDGFYLLNISLDQLCIFMCIKILCTKCLALVCCYLVEAFASTIVISSCKWHGPKKIIAYFSA